MALTIKLDQVGLAPGSSDPKENARDDGLPADVGGGIAAEISVTLTGFPVGAALDVELLAVPRLPTPDTNIGTSPAETPVGSGVFKFTPDALRYGKFRIRATATRSGGIVEEVIRTFGFKSPNKALLPPAFNERGARDASLINQGDDVKARTEDNSGVAGGTVDAYYDWMVALTKLVEEDFNVDSDAIHDNVAGEIAAVAEKVAPVAADVLLIEDSAAADGKKKIQIGNLPTNGFDADVPLNTLDAVRTVIDTYVTQNDESVIAIDALIDAWDADDAEVASFRIVATFKRDVGGVVAEQDVNFVHEYRDDVALPLPDFNISGQSIQIRVQGIALHDIGWRMRRFTVERQLILPP